jgi:hypothetical protein
MPKISDFILAYKSLEIVCDDFDCDFVDCEVAFDQSNDVWLCSGRTLHGPSIESEGQTLQKTIYSIVETYINHMSQITGKSVPRESIGPILSYIFAMVNSFAMKVEGELSMDRDNHFGMRLNQHPVVWMLIKDILCPMHQVELQDVRVIAGHSHALDAAVIFRPDSEDERFESNEPFIFLNLDVESPAIRSAFLFYRAVEFHFPDQDASSIIRNLFVDHFLRKDLVGFLRMAFENDEDVLQFFAVLSIITQMEEMEIIATAYSKNNLIKTAQYNPIQGSFWFQGLIEKMLDPVRAPDWSITKGWQPITEALWQKVEEERKRRGLAEVPFEMLLRISSDHLKVDKKQTLQGLLGDARVW